VNEGVFVLLAAHTQVFDFLEIAYSVPIEDIVIIKEVFPELISGKGSPVGGMLPLTTRALITV
jgi:hypothetical protein